MKNNKTKIFETERLILRPLTKEDAQDVFEWCSDPIVNKYLPYTLYENVNQVEEWIESIKDEENTFAFVLKDSGKVIGSGSISMDTERNAYELGYNINRNYWNKGYTTEASKGLIKWAYDVLDAREFCANYATANVASGKVLEKCGFEFEKYGQYSTFDGSETFDATFVRMHLD